MKTKFYPIVLEKEFLFLKLVKERAGEVNFLFMSLWDPVCINLAQEFMIDSVADDEDVSKKKPLYIIDSFNMPTVFPAMMVDKVPALVTIPKNKDASFFRKEEYVSNIYRRLGL